MEEIMFKKFLSMIGAGTLLWTFGASAQEVDTAKKWLTQSKNKIRTEKPLDFVVCEVGK